MNAETATPQTDGESVTGTIPLEQSGVTGSGHTHDLAAVLPAGVAVLNVTVASDGLSPHLACIHHDYTEHTRTDGLNEMRRQFVRAVHLSIQTAVPKTNHLRLRHCSVTGSTMSRIPWKT